MQIKNLSLQNFRNYEDEKFAFSEGLNILFGKNAQGKTNCAEAVFYLCTGTSLRIRHDRQLIKIGAPCARISAEAENRYGKVTIEADIYEDKREIRINGSKISKSADLMGHINSVFFSPGELRLIQDGPDERRRFMNMSISQTSPAYYTALLRYNKILDQRNTLLKNRDAELILDTLPVWDEQLCKYAAVIVEKRAEFLKKLAPYAKELHAFLTDGAEELEISPDRKYEGEEDEIAEKLKKQLSRNYEKDLRLGFTTVGPHRDDVDFFISGKGRQGIRFPRSDPHRRAQCETLRGGDFSGTFGGIPRAHSRRRDERARPSAAEKALEAHFRRADDSHLHARGNGCYTVRNVRKSESKTEKSNGEKEDS